MVFHSLLLFIIEYANTRSDRIWNINFHMSIFSRLLFVLYTRHSNQASLSSTSNPSLPHCMPKQTTGSPPSLLGACNFHACIAYNSCTNDSHYHCAHTHADGISCIFWQIVHRPRHRSTATGQTPHIVTDIQHFILRSQYCLKTLSPIPSLQCCWYIQQSTNSYIRQPIFAYRGYINIYLRECI